MKNFSCILFLLLLFYKLQAQQVTKTDCCIELGNKATIILNDNNATSNTVNPSTSNTVSNSFNFKLSVSANTSAGVYNSSDILIRTLWSGVRYDAGCYSGQWDGLLDDATQAPFGNYVIKVLTNNVQYTWEGVIGNNSTDLTGPSILHGDLLNDMCFVGTTAFLPGNYSEYSSSSKTFDISNPNKLTNISYGTTTQSSLHACSDGNVIYWAGANYRYGQADFYIYGSYPADGVNPYAAQVPFSAGTSIQASFNGMTYTKAISITLANDAANINSMCVQKSGNFLFVARGGLNQLQVLNKNTGLLLQTLTYPNVQSVVCDNSGSLFLSSNYVVNTGNYIFNPVKLTGSGFSTPEDYYPYPLAFDNDPNTAFTSRAGSPKYLGLDLGSNHYITKVSISPRVGAEPRSNNVVVQGSVDGTNYTDLYNVTAQPTSPGTTYALTNPGNYRYVRLYRNDAVNLDIAEFGVFESIPEHVLVSQVKKYSVNANGTLTDSGISLSGLSNATALAISPDYTTVSVIDEGTQQVKAYSATTGSALWTLGQAGGYANTPYVSNDRFMFSSPFIVYQPDGTFWLQDKGNRRILHFDANRNYIGQIAYVSSSRSTTADPNNPKRVFSNLIEYERDYTKPLDNGKNGSWKLKANWGYNFPNFSTEFSGFRSVATLSNGHTYAIEDVTGSIYDLTSTGMAAMGGSGAVLEADGSLYSRNNNNTSITITKQPLTGFIGNQPVWGTPVTIATDPNIQDVNSPAYYINNTRGSSTNANRYIFFNQNHDYDFGSGLKNLGNGYHLGAVKTGGNSYQWKTSKSTFFDYSGDYPNNGDFDIGNNAFGPGMQQHSENAKVYVYGTDIFWMVNGEFWKAGEINIWNHFNDDGLFVGQFGTTGERTKPLGAAPPQMAGNAYSGALVKVGNDYYIYHCDESIHAGVHSWKVTGLSTIQELPSIPITLGAPVRVAPDPADLMSGLPYRSGTFTGGNGWTVDAPTTGLNMRTNYLQYQKSSTDITFGGQGSQVVRRSLNNAAQLQSWTLSGALNLQGGEPTIARGTRPGNTTNYNYLEVLDVSGKIIARFTDHCDLNNSYYTYVLINNAVVAEGVSGTVLPNFRTYRDFSFNYVNGALAFKLANYNPVTLTSPFEPGANLAAPSYLRVNQGSTSNQNHVIDLYKLRFSGK